MEKVTLSKAVLKVITDMPNGYEFHGRELQRLVSRLVEGAGKKYPETILRVARKVCREKFICISMAKSLYKRVGNE